MISSCQGAKEKSMKISVRNDENVLELDSDDGCTTLNIHKTTELYTLKGDLYGIWIISQ